MYVYLQIKEPHEVFALKYNHLNIYYDKLWIHNVKNCSDSRTAKLS